MKMLNLLILVLAVTLFVACSKKKDGNTNPQGYNPYGVTPNDPNYHGYPNGGYQQPGMPGYQLPGQANCQGPGQMFSDLVSYCGWLARDGERLCNPMVVRQNFMQYCQSFAVRFNYCVPEVRSNCYYQAQGCSVQVRGTWERYSHSSTRERDSGSWTKKPGGQVIVHPPIKPQPNDCKPNPSVDCKKEKPKKSKLICKLPGDSSLETNYNYSLEEYNELACEDSSPRTAVQAAPAPRTMPTSTATVIPRGTVAPRATVIPKGTVAPQAAVAVSKPVSSVDSSQCLNIQEIHEYIIDQKNGLSSSAEFYQAELLNKNVSKNFVAEWKKELKKTIDTYSTSSDTSFSVWSAIGAHIEQRNDLFRLQKTADFGKIISCSNGKQMSAQFPNEIGMQQISYTSNYTMNDLRTYKSDDFEITETVRGTFIYGNESSPYILARYIGIGKKLSRQKIEAKIVDDMKRKKYFEVDPESVINH